MRHGCHDDRYPARIRSGALLILCLSALQVCYAREAASLRVDKPKVTVLCGHQDLYRLAADALKERLEREGATCSIIILPRSGKTEIEDALRELIAGKPDVIATGGEIATLLALRAVEHVPVVYFMVPNAEDAPFSRKDSPYQERTAGLAVDASPEDQLRLILHFQPGVRSVAILHSSETSRAIDTFRTTGRKGIHAESKKDTSPDEQTGEPPPGASGKPPRRFDIISIETRSDQFADALDKLSRSQCDAVLMLPDLRVYNSASVKELVLWGLRHRKPVWAFSENIVNAGALGGLWVEPAVNGRDAAGVVLRVLKGEAPSRIGHLHSSKTIKAINRNTATRIGIDLSETRTQDVLMMGTASP